MQEEQQAPPRFELGFLDSESKVLTVTPRDPISSSSSTSAVLQGERRRKRLFSKIHDWKRSENKIHRTMEKNERPTGVPIVQIVRKRLCMLAKATNIRVRSTPVAGVKFACLWQT